MSDKADSKGKKSKSVEVYNIIPDDVRLQLEVLDLENEEDEESESVEVLKQLPPEQAEGQPK